MPRMLAVGAVLGVAFWARPYSGAAAPVPEPLLGVTIDDVDGLGAIVESLRRLPRKPIARIVFDGGRPAAAYLPAVEAVQSAAFVMGELLDSYEMKRWDVKRFGRRVEGYLDILGSRVDVWEIGNEVNGEWLGDPDATAAKTELAYRAVRARGGRTALTLFFNEGCSPGPANDPFDWAARRLSPELRLGVDYVFLSYYEDDCGGRRPDWPPVFERLGRLFPFARLGFGEIGTKDPARKGDVLRRYYGLRGLHARYCGGYFWWFFRQDMVPHTRPLWSGLSAAFKAAP